jgi:hypothetical protein
MISIIAITIELYAICVDPLKRYNHSSFKCSTIWCFIIVVMLSTWFGTWSHKPKANMLHFSSMTFFLCYIRHVLILEVRL